MSGWWWWWCVHELGITSGRLPRIGGSIDLLHNKVGPCQSICASRCTLTCVACRVCSTWNYLESWIACAGAHSAPLRSGGLSATIAARITIEKISKIKKMWRDRARGRGPAGARRRRPRQSRPTHDTEQHRHRHIWLELRRLPQILFYVVGRVW